MNNEVQADGTVLPLMAPPSVKEVEKMVSKNREKFYSDTNVLQKKFTFYRTSESESSYTITFRADTQYGLDRLVHDFQNGLDRILHPLIGTEMSDADYDEVDRQVMALVDGEPWEIEWT